MVVYVAIWEDRHRDATIHAFSEKGKAIEWAKTSAKECDRFGDYKETILTADMIQDGWIFHCEYSCEGDGIRVVEIEIDSEIKGE